MNNSKTILSVIIFAYNHEKYIEQTILSVVNQQTKYSYEIVVCDDSSIDGTLSIIRSLESKYSDLIRIIHNGKNLGLNKSFENAVRSVDSEYISLLGGDDYWIDPYKIKKQIDILNSDKTISFIHTTFKSLNEQTGKIKDRNNKGWKFPETQDRLDRVSAILTASWIFYPNSGTSCFRRDILIKGLDEFPWILSFPTPGEGTILHLSMCLFGNKYYFMNEDTIMYRIISGSLSHKYNKLEQYIYNEQYVMLRIKICNELPYSQKRKKEIRNKILCDLFVNSVFFKQEKRFFNLDQSVYFQENNIKLNRFKQFYLYYKCYLLIKRIIRKLFIINSVKFS
jgi:glycosyltransferase involved in cell wall biosynthesis